MLSCTLFILDHLVIPFMPWFLSSSYKLLTVIENLANRYFLVKQLSWGIFSNKWQQTCIQYTHKEQ